MERVAHEQPSESNDDCLCERCIAIFTDGSLDHIDEVLESDPWTYGQLHHENRKSFEASVSAGCYICSSLPAEGLPDQFEGTAWYFRYDLYNEQILTLQFAFKTTTEQGFKKAAPTFRVVTASHSGDVFELARASLAEETTGSNGVVTLAKRWLTDCVDGHTSCHAQQNLSWRPTRLLDISGPSVRLVLTADLQEEQRLPYATMSHCWGKEPFFVLTSDNLSRFMEGMEAHEFPQSFQDIISVVRRLDVRYLWIDCYCIIQQGRSSLADWQKESAMMKDVYSHGIFNVGVTHASSPHEGCFRSRSRLPKAPLTISWQPHESGARSAYHIYSEPTTKPYSTLFRDNVMFSRGWVFQERLLSSRMLHFTSDQIYWECSGGGQMFASEEYPAGMFYRYDQQSEYPWNIGESGSVTPALWSDIVGQYSRLQLTKATSDKFLALGGVAQRATGLLRTGYAAGFLSGNMIAQLGWQARLRSCRHGEWRAPSWSWASMDGPISLLQFHGHAVATIIDLNIQLKDPSNSFGAIVAASMSLSCRPLTAFLRKDMYPESRQMLSIVQQHLFWSHDDFEEVQRADSEVIVLFTGFRVKLEGISSGFLSLEEITELPVTISNYDFYSSHAIFTGLVVQPLGNDLHSRLGVLELHEDIRVWLSVLDS